MAKKTVRNITISINGKEVENSLSGVGKEIGKTSARLRKLTRGTEEFKQESEKLKNLKKVYKEMNDEIRGQESTLSKLKKQVKSVGPAVIAAFSVTSIIAFANQLVDIVKEFRALKKETKDLTGLQGTLLDQAVSKTKALSDVYETDYNENLKTANALAKQFGVTYDEALEIIQKGYEAGADASGDMLSQLQEYAPQLKEANVPLEEMVALIAQTTKEGIFSDKGLDTIKEGVLRIREGATATREALDGIGIDSGKLYKELENGTISYIDAIKLVSKQLGEVESQSPKTGKAIADIFGGPGEDAGLKYLQSLKDIDTELDNLIDTTDEMTLLKRREVAINEELNDSWVQLSSAGGVLHSVYLDLKEAAAGFLTTINDTYTSSKRLEEITGRGYWKDGLLNPNEYERLNDFATSLRKMTQEAETAADPISALRTELTRLASLQLTAPTRTKEEKDRKKLIEAQIAEVSKLYSDAIDKREKETEEAAKRIAEIEQRATEAELKRQEAAAARKREQYQREEDAIDALIADKQRQREINKLSGIHKELAMIDAKYDKEVEKYKNHADRIQEIETQREQDKADAKFRITADYILRTNDLEEENRLLKEEAEFERELEAQETELEKEEMRLARAEEIALRELERLRDEELAKVEVVEGAEAMKAAIREKYELQADKVKREFNKQEKALRIDQVKWTEMSEAQKLSAITGALGAAADAFNEGSEAWKAIKISETLIATYQSAQNAFNALSGIPIVGPALGGVAAGLAVVAGLKRVQQISNTKMEKMKKPRGKGLFEGGPTGDTPIGYDSDGAITQVWSHKNEWVAPEIMTQDPKYANTIGWLENERQKIYGRGYATGGSTGGVDFPTAPQDATSAALLQSITVLNERLATPLRAEMLYGYEDEIKRQSIQDDLNNSSSNASLT